jgi:hypothetical protein
MNCASLRWLGSGGGRSRWSGISVSSGWRDETPASPVGTGGATRTAAHTLTIGSCEPGVMRRRRSGCFAAVVPEHATEAFPAQHFAGRPAHLFPRFYQPIAKPLMVVLPPVGWSGSGSRRFRSRPGLRTAVRWRQLRAGNAAAPDSLSLPVNSRRPWSSERRSHHPMKRGSALKRCRMAVPAQPAPAPASARAPPGRTAAPGRPTPAPSTLRRPRRRRARPAGGRDGRSMR